MDNHRNNQRKQGLRGLMPMDVPWDGVREDRVTCFLCSSAFTIALRKHLCVQMGSLELELVKGYCYKCEPIQGGEGQFSPLAKLVCVVNGS